MTDTTISLNLEAFAMPTHELLYQGIRAVPQNVLEIEQYKPRRFVEHLVAWAEIFTAHVDLFSNPLPSRSQVRVKHWLDRFKGALSLYHHSMAELTNRHFLRDQELKAVERNRAYRGFDYSPQIKGAVSAIESEVRQTRVAVERVLQDTVFNIVVERERVVGAVLPTEDHANGVTISRFQT